MILTKDGASHEKAEEILTKLEFAEQTDILQIAYSLFTLVLNEDDQQWLMRRSQQMYELFRETPFYKEMTKAVREEALQEGREEALRAIQEALRAIEEERQKRLQDNRQTLINLVQKLFPSIAILARKQAENITEPFVLQEMITKMLSVNTLEEAVQYLVEVPDTTEKHD